MKSKNVENKKGKGKPIEAPILKRKQLRKGKRLAKKKTKKEHIASKYKKGIIQQLPKIELKETVNENEEITTGEDKEVTPVKKQVTKKEKLPKVKTQEVKKAETNRKTEKELKELKRQQKKQRKLQLKVENKEEERNVKMLKKQLGLKKQKSKNLSKAFSDDESSSKRFKMDNINDSSDNSEEDDNLANEVLGNKDESHESEMSEDEKEEDCMEDADSTVKDNDNRDDIESDCDELTENLPKPENHNKAKLKEKHEKKKDIIKCKTVGDTTKEKIRKVGEKHGSKKELFTKKDGKEQTAAVNECKKKQSNKFEENKEEYHNVDKQFDKAGKDFCLLYKAKSRFIAHGAHQANSTLELQNQNIVKQLYKNSYCTNINYWGGNPCKLLEYNT